MKNKIFFLKSDNDTNIQAYEFFNWKVKFIPLTNGNKICRTILHNNFKDKVNKQVILLGYYAIGRDKLV